MHCDRRIERPERVVGLHQFAEGPVGEIDGIFGGDDRVIDVGDERDIEQHAPKGGRGGTTQGIDGGNRLRELVNLYSATNWSLTGAEALLRGNALPSKYAQSASLVWTS